MKIRYTKLFEVPSAPLFVNFLITNRCNLKCRHCFIPFSNRSSRDELNREEIKELIRQLKEAKVFNIDIGGGEPLIRDDFFDVMEIIFQTKIRIGALNTNGTLITRDVAKKLAKYNIGVYIVSLDGSTPEIYGKMRGDEEAFRQVIQGIRNLVREGLEVRISTIVTKCNFKDLINIVFLGKDLGVSSVRFNHMFYAKPALRFLKELKLSKEDQIEVLETVYKLYQEFGDFIKGTYVEAIKIIDKLERSTSLNITTQILPCPAGTTKCAIRGDGWVVPCEILFEKKIGSVKNNNFLEIWTNSEAWQEFRTSFELLFDEKENCKKCIYFPLCYQGHRCYPYYLPEGVDRREAYCLSFSTPKKRILKGIKKRGGKCILLEKIK